MAVSWNHTLFFKQGHLVPETPLGVYFTDLHLQEEGIQMKWDPRFRHARQTQEYPWLQEVLKGLPNSVHLQGGRNQSTEAGARENASWSERVILRSEEDSSPISPPGPALGDHAWMWGRELWERKKKPETNVSVLQEHSCMAVRVL